MRGGKLKRWAAIVLVILVTSGCAGMNLPIATTPTVRALNDTIDAILQPDKGHGERTRRPEPPLAGFVATVFATAGAREADPDRSNY